MKKSLIALAVAGAFAAPAFAATSNVDVYGILNVAIQDTNAANNEMQVTDNVSRIGFKGSEDLGGGLKAVWQIEQQLSGTASDGVGTGSATFRNTFVGLAGGFGTVLMGRHDTPYKLGTGSLDIFGDTIGDYNGRLTDGTNTIDPVEATHDARSASAIAYVSPTWSGFHFAVAGVATNTTSAAQRQFDSGNDTLDALSATAVYSNGPLFGSLSYQNVYDTAGAAGDQGSKAWKLGLGYTFGDAKVGFVYEDINNDAAGAVNGGIDRSSWLINGVYNMGPIALKAQYAKIKDFQAAGVDPTKWDIGADYSLSKRTTAYVVYTSTDNDIAAKDLDGFNIGLKHSF